MSHITFYRSSFYNPSTYIKPHRIVENCNIINNVDVLPLTEELHSFEGQTDLSKELAQHILFMLEKDIKQQDYFPQNNNVFKVVNIDLMPSETNNIRGDIRGFNIETKTVMLTIYINKLILGFQSSNIILNRLSHVIAHELMHGYIFTQKETTEETMDIPPYYGTALSIMRHGYEGIIQDFAYALYATYYHETQAIISQANTNVEMILNSRKITNPNTNDLVKIVKQIEPYGIFEMVIGVSQEVLRMNDETIQKEIVEPLKRFHFECSEQWIRNQSNKMINIAQKALRKIIRNSLLIFEN